MKYKRVITTSKKWPGMLCATVSGELTPVDRDERFDLSFEQETAQPRAAKYTVC